MSLLWRTAAGSIFDRQSEVYYHPDRGSLRPEEASDIPLRFRYDPATSGDGGAWKAYVPDDHPGHKEHGWLAGYAHVESRDLPEDHPDDPGGYTTHVKMIETNPGYEGHGVGKALLQHVIQQSGFHGVTHGGLTEGGSRLWKSVTGQDVPANETTVGNHRRDWRWAV